MTPPAEDSRIDANAALTDLREAIRGYDTAETSDEEAHHAEIIRDRVADLDTHLTMGGRLPMAWRARGPEDDR